MRNVPPPTADSKAYYRERVAATRDKTNRRRLRRIRESVEFAYVDYDAKCRTLERIFPSPVTALLDKAALQDLYRRNRTKLRALIVGEWRAEDRAVCPLCALGEPHTLDHYVPEGAFPEFCLHLPNLVPACAKCQGHKLSRFLENGERLFLHCYYDSINAYKILRCQIDFSTDPPSCAYDIRHPPGMSDRAFSVVKSNFEKLKLGERYVAQVSARIAQELMELRGRYAEGVSFPDIRAECQREAGKTCQRYGENHWETAFYKALTASLPESALS